MLEKIEIMAIIREVDPEITIEVIKALAEEGLQSFEISLSDPELGIEAIRRSLEYFQGSDVRIGAGTVSTVKQVERLAGMGVPYFLTPGFDPDIVESARTFGLEILPGVLTPTDVQMALNHGITRMKLFPADAFGEGYIKALKGPYPQTEYVAVGGVNLDTAASYLQRGFAGIAVGSNLVPRGAVQSQIEEIREKGRKYMEIVHAFEKTQA